MLRNPGTTDPFRHRDAAPIVAWSLMVQPLAQPPARSPLLAPSPGGTAVPAALADIPQPLFVFDGVCVLCSGAVRFVLARERDRSLRFAAAQSPLGQVVYDALGLPVDRFESMVVIEQGHAFVKSIAALHLARHLRQPWRLLGALTRILPLPLRDWLYDKVAENRYALFGRYDACMVPDSGTADRFVDTIGSSQPR